MADGNPFASPPPPAYGGAPGGNEPVASNPFDPMAPPPQDPFSANNEPLLASSSSTAAAAAATVPGAPSYSAAAPSSYAPVAVAPAVAENPFGAPVSLAPTGPTPSSPTQQYGAPTPAATGSPFAAPPQPQASLQPQQYQQPYSQQAGYSPIGGGIAASPYDNNAIVVSQHQSNPYAGLVTPVPSSADPFGQSTQAIVPSGQQPNQWALGGAAPAPVGSAASFDPFAPPPPPPPPPPPAPAVIHPDPPAPVAPIPDDYVTSTPSQQQLQQQQPPPSSYPEQGDLGPFGESAPAPAPSPPEPEQQQQQHGGPPDEPVIDHNRIDPPSYDYGQQKAPEPDHDPDGQRDARNPYREELARQAPPGSSPLPKAELVRKKGFVLSRISFRTIVMKKWKQTFWVQYGPHTMLWFRSESDFSDWLNNPYHDQAQRNFLIKLAVNFVHDLYKPNVRGYQVTQCRTKAYGNKMIRQFKLERWMDYGPTIAAAFGSYNPREVDDLRLALVECMRNTPLNSGIRATGAVRQQQQQQHLQIEDRPRGEEGLEGGYDGNPPGDRPHPANMPPHEGQNGQSPAAPESDSVPEEADLLDVDNWDDVPKLPPAQQQQMVNSAYGVAAAPPPPQQNGYGGPAAYGAEQSYPGQQSPTQQPSAYQTSQPYAQGSQQPQQAYPGMAQQDPWASGAAPSAGQPQYAAPPQPGVQQQPYGAPPPQAQQYPTQQATY